jgi:hypothetical protein
MDSKKGGNSATASKSSSVKPVLKTSQKMVETTDLFADSSKTQPLSKSHSPVESVPLSTHVAKYIESMRSVTTTNLQAQYDFIDNCIDAGASVISLTTEWNTGKKGNQGPKRFILTDNGSGMTREDLLEAWALGSESGKGASELGRFGVGLNQSAISFCKKITTYTRNGDNDILVGVYDIGHIKNLDEFALLLHDADDDEKRFFESELENLNKNNIDVVVPSSSSGTVFVFEEIDRFTWDQQTAFVSRLAKPQTSAKKRTDACIGEVFRVYIKNGNICVLLDGSPVVAYDPIRDLERVGELLEVSVEAENGTLEITMVELKTNSRGESSEKGIGYYTRGAYVMRNDRQIVRADDLSFLPIKNDVNNFRMELRFNSDGNGEVGSAVFDTELKLSNDKTSIEMNTSLRKKVSQATTEFVKRVAANAAKKRNERSEEKLNTLEAEKQIARKAHLLEPVKGQVETRKSGTRKGNGKPAKPYQGGSRKPRKSHYAIDSKKRAVFTSFDGGVIGPIYGDPELTDDNKIKIKLNREHPIYDFICESGTLDITNPTLLFIYAMSRTELRAVDEEDDATFMIVREFRHDTGKMLSTLMS